MKKNNTIFIIAGEPSGDNIGAKLIKALKEQNPSLKFKGVGGPKMQAQGLISIFPMQELSIMGFIEVIPSIPRVIKRLNDCLQAILKFEPTILITIDSFGFNSRLAKRAREKLGNKLKIIHYVAPTVWAYKPERANVIAQLYDHQLLILPFEKPYFDAVNIKATYVQNPIVEDALQKNEFDPKAIRKKYGISHHSKIVVMMPGSRAGEIKRHAKIFANVLKSIKKESNVFVFIPTFLHMEKVIKEYFPHDCLISHSEITKREIFSIADAALVKSGTSSAEMMLHSIPCIVAYKANFLSYLYIKAKITVKYVSIANIIADEEVIPEFIQNDCTEEKLNKALTELLKDSAKRQKQKQKFKEILKTLGYNSKPTPSQQAAKIVVGYLK